MKRLTEKYGRAALVAGASEGLGLAFAQRLAREGMDLIMIARRKDVLEAQADAIRKSCNVNVTTVACDLSGENITGEISSQTKDAPVDLLVYNAALSYIGPFLDHPLDAHERIIAANLSGQVKLAHHYGSKMAEKGRGAMIFMSSMAGFQGSGFLTTYSSTKAFNRVFAEGLWYEWKRKNIDVLACCAGAIATPNYVHTNPKVSGWLRPPLQQPEEVADECFRRLGKVPSFVSGRGNRLATFFMHRILSRKKAVIIMGDQTRKMYGVGD